MTVMGVFGSLPLRILIAEDQAHVQKGLQALFQLEDDMEVVGIANNGLEAVDLAERLRPNVILMDLSMPYLDGLEATQLIRSRESAAAVVLMATATDPTLWHQARQAGAVALIEKGAPGTELAQVIRSVLQSKP